MKGSRRQAALDRLVVEIDRYLCVFDHPCIDEVRRGIARWGHVLGNQPTPQQIPACRHLDAALAATAVAPLVDAIDCANEYLQWVTYDSYPAAEIGQSFAEGHSFASLIGGASPFKAEDFDLGLFLIAPNVLYRDHHHAAPELYAPLTGPHGWRFRPGTPFEWQPAHSLVWNEPWQPHATMVGETPFLCIYAWTRDVNDAARVIAAEDWAYLESTP